MKFDCYLLHNATGAFFVWGKSTMYKYRLQHRTDLKHQYSALSHKYPQTWIIGFYIIKFTCYGAPQLAKLNTPPLKRTRYTTGNPGSVIVPQYGSSKITVFVLVKNTILKFLGNTK